MRAVLAAIAGLGLAAIVVACGGATKTPASPPTHQGVPGMPETPRQRIDALDRAIDDDLAALGLAPAIEAMGATPLAVDPRTVDQVAATCTPPAPPPGTCGDTCTVGSRICDNARQICELAAELAPDAYAADKCERGKVSCEAAQKQCCACR